MDRVIPSRELNARQMALVEPVGPVAAFVTWNGPLVTPSRKCQALWAQAVRSASGFSRSAGMRVRVRPDRLRVRFCRLVSCRCLLEKPVTMSKELLESPVMRAVTFTGSTAVGKLLSQQAVAHMKRPIMELGGHGPVLAFEGIDVQAFAKRAVAAKFANSGQVCFAPTRFYIQRSIYADVVDAMTAEAKQIVVGCGFDSTTQMGPLKSERRLNAIEDLVADAKQRGLSITTGGNRIDRPGSFYEPTIVADVTIDAKLSNAEPFGPIAAFTSFDTYDEAMPYRTDCATAWALTCTPANSKRSTAL